MKKYFGFTLFALLIIAFSATAYAAEFKASGLIYNQAFLYQNIPAETSLLFGGPTKSYDLPGGGAFDRTKSWLASRARLKFEMVADKSLSGTIFLEADSSRWGDKDGTRNSFGFWSADRAAVEVKNVFVDVGLPYFGIPAPMTLRVGLQPAFIRGDVLMDTDGIGIVGNIKADPVTIIPMWFKAIEGKDASADDSDYYALEMNTKIDKITIGAYGLYLNAKTYPYDQVTPTGYGSTSDYKAEMLWLGAYSDGKMGPFDYKLDLAYDNGEVTNRKDPTADDVDYTGWVGSLRLEYPWEKFTFGVAGMYASGADARKSSNDGLDPGTNGHKVGSWVIPASEGGNYSNNLSIFYSNGLTTAAPKYGRDDTNQMSRGWLGGTWMAKLYASYKMAPWYKVTLGAMYIGDTTKHGNTIGTALKSDLATLRDDKDIGIEFGLLNNFEVYKNLTFNLGFGWLVPGDALEYFDATKGKNVDPDDPWAVFTRLQYNF
ncbi:MAG: hypothetical protein ACE144_03535 [Thermodesulfobacteriota bacterium]